MIPTPGGTLDLLSQQLNDPSYKILAHLAKGPTGVQDVVVNLATLVEADFAGYAPIRVQPDLDTAKEVESYGQMSPFRLHFEAGAIVAPQTITHIYYTGQYAGGTVTLLSAIPWDVPFTFATQGDVFEVDALVGCLDVIDA